MYRIKIEKFDRDVEPQHGDRKEIDRMDIYEQVVDTLDINAVIKAINPDDIPNE